jgi:large subunit ribosomal protein L5
MGSLLKEKYKKEIAPALKQKFGIKNVMRIPRVEKIVINMGVGKAASENNIKLLDAAMHDLSLITGQKPSMTRSKRRSRTQDP